MLRYIAKKPKNILRTTLLAKIMIRKPIASGQFYESDARLLEKQITDAFHHKLGPGELQVSKRQGILKAVITPHAGYAFSGPCAAWSYMEIGESEFPSCYIIIGPSHSGRSSSVSFDEWLTPLGLVMPQRELGKMICERIGIKKDEGEQANEHSIEVQLPFLQFVSKDNIDNLRIVPICLNNDINLKKFALEMKEIIMDWGKDVVFIISSDFTHYGPAYGYLPFEIDKEQKLYDMDKTAIDFIKNFDAKGLLSFIDQTGATICGAIPIALLISTIKAKNVALMQYYTSGDLSGSFKNAVGYAAISFK